MPTAIPYHHDQDAPNDIESDEESVSTEDSDHEGYVEHPREASPLEELESEDFPNYFVERDERLFHAHPTSPYPLPVDGREQRRQKDLHALGHQLFGFHYLGPVPDVLAPEPDRQKRVLDLCTGTGVWAMDMARLFPHVLFEGIDIVPIATRYPLPNVRFVIGDITEDFDWDDNYFDLIHARTISMALRDYHTILPGVVQVLRPGGLFLSVEWDTHTISFESPETIDPVLHAPAITHLFEAVDTALSLRGVVIRAHEIPAYLVQTGSFSEIVPQVFHVPIGTWHSDATMRELGGMLSEAFSCYAESVRPLLIDAGNAPDVVDILIENFSNEVTTLHGLMAVVHTVYARKA